MRSANRGDPVFALPVTRFGPQLDAHFRLHTTGIYQMWASSPRRAEDVITVPFSLQVR